MTIEQVRRIAFPSLLLLATLALGLAEGNLLWPLLVAGAVAVTVHLVLQDRESLLPDSIINTLAALMLVVVMFPRLYHRSNPFGLEELCHYLILIHVTRLMGRRTTRDHAVTATIAFALFLVAAVQTTGLSFLLSLLLMTLGTILVVATFALDPSVVRRAMGAPPAGPRSASNSSPKLQLPSLRPLSRAVLPFAAVLAAGALALAFVLFFVVPRPAGALSSWRGESPRDGRAARDDIYAGFSDEVNLNRFGQIKRSMAHALTVRTFREGHAESLTPSVYSRRRPLWRGLAFADYNNGVWSKPDAAEQLRAGADGWTEGEPWAPTRGWVIEQEVRSFVQTPMLFGLPTIVATNLSTVRRDELGSLRTTGVARTYRVRSRIIPWDGRAREALLHAPLAFDERYLNIAGINYRLRALLQQELARIEALHTARPWFERIQRIEDHLQSERNFRYTMDVPDPGPRDPVEAFLLPSGRAGHCGLYASTMVLMLRMQGIPARLASGYAAEPGWGVRGRSEYSLPQNAAHAWVEVPFVGFGWVAFDPTGPDSSRRNTQAAEQTRREAAEQEDTSGPARHGREPGLTDRLSHLWRTQIVGFDAGRQRQMYRRWGQGLQGLLKMPDPSGLRWLIVPAAVVILGLVVLRLLGRLRMPRFGRRARAGQTPAQRAAQRFYQEMIRILARRGYVRRSSQTPAAFAETIRRGGFAESDAVQRLTQLFERARYGGDEPNADEQREIIDLLTRLRHSAKGKKGIQAREGLRKDATVTAK